MINYWNMDNISTDENRYEGAPCKVEEKRNRDTTESVCLILIKGM